MNLFMFLKGLFTATPEQLEKRKEEQKATILSLLRKYRQADGYGITGLALLYLAFHRKHFGFPPEEFIKLLEELVESGFIQRLDGGNKLLPPSAVTYIISENGLTHLNMSLLAQ